MNKKGNKVVSIICTVLLFSLIAVLYVVPSVEAIKGDVAVATLTPTEQKESTSVPAKEKAEVPSTPTSTSSETKTIQREEDEYTLHIHRDLSIQGHHIVVDAYDGYGYIKLPASLRDEDLAYSLALAREQLGAYAEEVRYIAEPGLVSLTYNQGHSEADINSLIDAIQEAIGADVIEVPLKPTLFIDGQELLAIEPVVENESFEIKRSLTCLGLSLEAIATNGHASVSYPAENIRDEEIISALMDIESSLNYPVEVEFAISEGNIDFYYSPLYSKEDLNFALDLLQSYLDKIAFAEPEIRIPSPAKISIASQSLVGEHKISHLNRPLPLLGDSVTVDAYDGNAIVVVPEYITEEELATALADIYSIYGDLLSDFDFAIENNAIEILYSTGYTEGEINYLLDGLELFLASIEYPEVVEPAVIESDKEESTAIPVKPSFVVTHIQRELPLLDSVVKVDAYDGNAIFVLPAYVTEEDSASAIATLCSYYGQDIADFDFSVENNIIEATYPEGYSAEQINLFLDIVESYLSDIEAPKVEEKVIRVPKKPSLTVAYQDFTPIHIYREMEVLNSVVKVDAYSGYADFIYPSFIEEEDLADGIVDIITTYYPLFGDFDFAIGEDLNVTYSSDYTEDELNALLDTIANALLAIERPLPSKPALTLSESYLQDKEVYVKRVLDIYGEEVEVEAYSDHAIFTYPEGIDQEIVADAIVQLYSSLGSDMKDFDFALDSSSAEAFYSDSYTEEELNSFISAIENFFREEKKTH